jgi:DUF4097 and DUF4098 domain-containing protein YvlB
MKTISRISILTNLLLFSLFAHASAIEKGEIKQTFKNVKMIKIKTVSGDCIIKKGDGEEVKVVVTYTYDDSDFEPELEQRGDRLILTENFRGRTTRGKSTWSLTVPEKTNIDFSTASGNLEVNDLKSTVEASTASGNVDLTNLTGEVQVSTASGDVEAKGLQGQVKFSTASGDVDFSGLTGEIKISTASGRINGNNMEGEIKLSTASGKIDVFTAAGGFEVSAASGNIELNEIVLKAESSFSAASGDVEVTLGESPAYDLEVSTASGDAVLNFNNHPIKGLVKMTAKANRGRIKAPFEFDDEEYYFKWNNEYVTKTVKKVSDRPRIEIRTASGKAVLLEK